MADKLPFTGPVEFNKTSTFKGALSVTDTTEAGSKTTGALKVAGGISCEKKVHTGLAITAESGDVLLKAGTLHIENGGTGTQASNKETTVTMSPANVETGQITTHNQAMSQTNVKTFTVNCNKVAATDVVLVNHVDVAVGEYLVQANNIQAGASFDITITRMSSTGDPASDALVLRYAVIKGSHT